MLKLKNAGKALLIAEHRLYWLAMLKKHFAKAGIV
jgi:hypothetical protein